MRRSAKAALSALLLLPAVCFSQFKKYSNEFMNIGAGARGLAAEGRGDDVGRQHRQGDAEEEARKFVQYLLQNKITKPACFLLGGETTVTVEGAGKGGRNQQFALAALHELIRSNVSEENFPIILAAGTDGTDGPTEAAGAIAGINVFQRMKAASLNAEMYLNNNDAYHFFQQTGGLFITGPTQTNVMDIIVAIVNNR